MRSLVLWLVLLFMAEENLSARILAVVPFPGKSHYIFANSILKVLALRGHDVVEYSPFPPKTPVSNLTHVEIHTRFENILDNWNYESLKKTAHYDSHMFRVRRIWEVNYPICEDTLQHENVQKLLKSDEKFDLVITESMFGQESMLVLGHRFSAPTITIETFYLWSVLNRVAGNSLNIATFPDLLPFVLTDEMSFKERVLNFVAVSSSLFFYHHTHIPRQEEILKRHYLNAPPLIDLIYNVSLYFTNSRPTAINYARPYTPNIVPVGGIHILPERNPLPQDVQKFMDEAAEGVIYFSLGTMVPIHRLPIEILHTFVNVFNKIPQRVLWKIDFDGLPPTSRNVMIVKWVPQPGVLAHPNCVLFITHGGLFSQHEAVHAGVPTVGIPFFADQPLNIRFNEHRGIGVGLDFYSLSEEKVYKAITSVLKNPVYKQNAAKMSEVYRDVPVSAADSAVFWTEYVLKHGGAHHLRPASAMLPWHQLALLDVLAAVLAVLSILLAIVFLAVRKILSCVWPKEKKSGSKTNGKQD